MPAVNQFIMGATSKRGWAALLTPAVDKRVIVTADVRIAPDVLPFRPPRL